MEDFTRNVQSFEDKSARFRLRDKGFMKQYFGAYISRLDKMADRVTSEAVAKFGTNVPVKKLSDLREDEPEKCIIVGTLFKQQSLKPSILREVADETHVAPQPVSKTCFDKSDKLVLEDGMNRIGLVGKVDVSKLVTGIVVAVLGYENDSGEFEVEDMVFYSPVDGQRELKPLTTSPLLVIISGIDQSSKNDVSLSLELFQQWIYGNLAGFGGGRDLEAASVCRLIVAGNSMKSGPEMRTKTIQSRVPETLDVLEAVVKVDKFLGGLCRSVNVDLMPGEFDPANHLLPQQPMHYCMFPELTKHNSFTGVTNPYHCEVADREILGTSGQNVNDLMKFADLSQMETLKCTLDWGHISPTCPDTLASYPFTDNDPFVVAPAYPHVYFAGNTNSFETELYNVKDKVNVRLVCVPKFSDTQTVAVINLATLDCYPVSFKINALDEIEE